jgi:hypothetical protein
MDEVAIDLRLPMAVGAVHRRLRRRPDRSPAKPVG